MNVEEFRDFCLSLPAVTEGFPFGGGTLVFKVMDKMFALCDVDQFVSINLKCDPETAVSLRERYASVTPGYHMNKKYWNTLAVAGELSPQELRHWIRHSYDQVVQGLPKAKQRELAELAGP
jgi:predicted DNA-binding protein (MmcQ/YjbR family)